MNIREWLVQEQKQSAGMETGSRGTYVKSSQSTVLETMQPTVTKVSGIGRNREVPVTPGSIDKKNSGIYTQQSQVQGQQVQDAKETQRTAEQTLAVLTGEDYQTLASEEGNALEEYQEGEFARAVERIRTERRWKAERQEENLEFRKQLQEDLEKIQVGGFLSQKSEAQIRHMLEQANLPATSQMIGQVMNTLQMYQDIGQITDAATYYIVEGAVAPTVENLYQGTYSGNTAISNHEIEAETWQEYEAQVLSVLQEISATDETQLQSAKWLFANELPITVKNLELVQQVQQMQEPIPLEKMAEEIIVTMMQGKKASEVIPGDTTLLRAEKLVEQVENIRPMKAVLALKDTAEIETARQHSSHPEVEALTLESVFALQGTDTVKVAQGTVLSETEITQYRQLEEIRLRMTCASVMQMWKQGIEVETQPLADLVERLRQMEAVYYQSEGTHSSEMRELGQIGQMQDTMEMVREIATAPAEILGASVRKHELITVRQLHSAATSQIAHVKQYMQDYEAVSTKVRSDLGDTLKKAWTSVPGLLKDLGMEITRANERAVRILGYNQMEVTKENVCLMRAWDGQVNQMLDKMKPSVVLTMIRQGENPLDYTVEELNQKLTQYDKEDAKQQESFSKFLWQLEKNDAIASDERDSYIGIYRLLRQIEKSDGAAIGAVWQTSGEMTLQNLLTAIRTKKNGHQEYQIDDTTDIRQSGIPENSITRQIDTAFYDVQNAKILEQITPGKIWEITQGVPEKCMDLPLDQMADALEGMQHATEEDARYYQYKADEVRGIFEQASEMQTLLEHNHIPPTLENLQGALAYRQEGSLIKGLYHGARKYGKEEAYIKESLVREEDVWEQPDDLLEKVWKADHYMEKVLGEIQQTADISYSDMAGNHQLLGMLRLHSGLAKQENYEIPVQAGDTFVCMNLTLRREGEQSGKVQVSIEEPMEVFVEIRMQDGEIKGLVLCNERQGYDALCQHKQNLEDALQSIGCRVKNISYGMDFRQADFWQPSQQNTTDTSGKLLYKAAKVLVGHIAKITRVTEK